MTYRKLKITLFLKSQNIGIMNFNFFFFFNEFLPPGIEHWSPGAKT